MRLPAATAVSGELTMERYTTVRGIKERAAQNTRAHVSICAEYGSMAWLGVHGRRPRYDVAKADAYRPLPGRCVEYLIHPYALGPGVPLAVEADFPCFRGVASARVPMCGREVLRKSHWYPKGGTGRRRSRGAGWG